MGTLVPWRQRYFTALHTFVERQLQAGWKHLFLCLQDPPGVGNLWDLLSIVAKGEDAQVSESYKDSLLLHRSHLVKMKAVSAASSPIIPSLLPTPAALRAEQVLCS